MRRAFRERRSSGCLMMKLSRPLLCSTERKAAADTLEKGDAQFLFERRHLTAEGGLRHAERRRRRRERAFLRRHQEGAGAVPIEGDGTPIHAKMHTKPTDLVNSLVESAAIHSRGSGGDWSSAYENDCLRERRTLRAEAGRTAGVQPAQVPQEALGVRGFGEATGEEDEPIGEVLGQGRGALFEEPDRRRDGLSEEAAGLARLLSAGHDGPGVRLRDRVDRDRTRAVRPPHRRAR